MNSLDLPIAGQLITVDNSIGFFCSTLKGRKAETFIEDLLCIRYYSKYITYQLYITINYLLI